VLAIKALWSSFFKIFKHYLLFCIANFVYFLNEFFQREINKT
jgi:hypothetical protein